MEVKKQKGKISIRAFVTTPEGEKVDLGEVSIAALIYIAGKKESGGASFQRADTVTSSMHKRS